MMLPGQGPSENPFMSKTSTENPFMSQASTQPERSSPKKPFLHSAGLVRATQTPGRFSKLWASTSMATEEFKKAYKEATQTNVETPAKRRRHYY